MHRVNARAVFSCLHLAEEKTEAEAFLELTGLARVIKQGPNPGLRILKFSVFCRQPRCFLHTIRDLSETCLVMTSGLATWREWIQGTDSDTRPSFLSPAPPFLPTYSALYESGIRP